MMKELALPRSVKRFRTTANLIDTLPTAASTSIAHLVDHLSRDSDCAARTLATYRKLWTRFYLFVQRADLPPHDPVTCALWIGAHAQRRIDHLQQGLNAGRTAPGWGPAALRQASSALGAACAAQGRPKPAHHPDWRAWLDELVAHTTVECHQTMPLGQGDLYDLIDGTHADPIPFRGLRDRTLLALSWACGLRREEIVRLRVGDLRRVSGRWTLVVTRPHHDSETRPIPRSSQRRYDPIAIVRSYLTTSGLDHGPLFRQVARNGDCLDDGVRERAINHLLQRLAPTKPWTAGSLRLGFIASMCQKGIALATLEAHIGPLPAQARQRYAREQAHRGEPISL